MVGPDSDRVLQLWVLVREDGRVSTAHLDLLAVYLHQPLPEVHPDRGLGSVGEFPGAEAVGQAGLPHPGVPDHDDFEDASPRRRKSRVGERAGEITAAVRHDSPTAYPALVSGGGVLSGPRASAPRRTEELTCSQAKSNVKRFIKEYQK